MYIQKNPQLVIVIHKIVMLEYSLIQLFTAVDSSSLEHKIKDFVTFYV